MMFYNFTDEQENGGGNTKSQDCQQGNYQYACHGEPPFLFVLIFTISLVVCQDKYNSAGILSFAWEWHPTALLLSIEKYYWHPTQNLTIG
jgi:hypothetical protein